MYPTPLLRVNRFQGRHWKLCHQSRFNTSNVSSGIQRLGLSEIPNIKFPCTTYFHKLQHNVVNDSPMVYAKLHRWPWVNHGRGTTLTISITFKLIFQFMSASSQTPRNIRMKSSERHLCWLGHVWCMSTSSSTRNRAVYTKAGVWEKKRRRS